MTSNEHDPLSDWLDAGDFSALLWRESFQNETSGRAIGALPAAAGFDSLLYYRAQLFTPDHGGLDQFYLALYRYGVVRAAIG